MNQTVRHIRLLKSLVHRITHPRISNSFAHSPNTQGPAKKPGTFPSDCDVKGIGGSTILHNESQPAIDHISRLGISDTNDQSLAQRPRGAVNRVQRNGGIFRIEQRVELGAACMEFFAGGCFVFFFSRMASESCHEITRLTGTASTSSRMPSSSRKLSKVETVCLALFFFFPLISTLLDSYYSP